MRSAFTGLAAVLASFVCPSAHADELPRPEDVLEAARVDRMSFTDAVWQLQVRIPEMRDRGAFFGYLGIMDELREIERELEFPVVLETPLRDLGEGLVRGAIKTLAQEGAALDYAREPAEILEELVEWGAEDDLELLLRQHQLRLSSPLDAAALEAAIVQAAAMIDRLGRRQPAFSLFLTEHHADYQGQALALLLARHGDVAVGSRLGTVLAALRRPSSLRSPMEQLLDDALRATEVSVLQRLSLQAVAMKRRVDGFGAGLDVDLVQKPGQAMSLLLLKLAQNGGSLSVSETSAAVSILSATQTEVLATRLLAMDLDWLQRHQVAYMSQLAESLATALGALGLLDEQDLMERLAEQIVLFGTMNETPVEGVYQVSFGGATHQVTVIRSGTVDMAVGLMIQGEPMTMGYARFDRGMDRYEVSSVHPEVGPSLDQVLHVVRFQQQTQGQLAGTLETGHRRYPIMAQQSAPVPDYFSRPPETEVAFVGTYKGVVTGDALIRDAELRIFRHGRGVAGVLILNPSSDRLRIDFDQAYDNPRNNVLYLTRRDCTSRLLQLRGQLTEFGFSGVFIRAGSNVLLKVELMRIP